MRFKIDGKTWRRRVVNGLRDKTGKKLYGDCLHSKRVIRVVRGQDERDELDTDLHEALHAIFPQLNEDAIWNAAGDLTGLLFDKLQYRRFRP